MKKRNRNICVTFELCVSFLLWTNAISCLDVQSIESNRLSVDFVTLNGFRAVDKPPNFVNVTKYHDKNLVKIAEIFQRKRSWFSMPWPLSSF